MSSSERAILSGSKWQQESGLAGVVQLYSVQHKELPRYLLGRLTEEKTGKPFQIPKYLAGDTTVSNQSWLSRLSFYTKMSQPRQPTS